MVLFHQFCLIYSNQINQTKVGGDQFILKCPDDVWSGPHLNGDKCLSLPYVVQVPPSLLFGGGGALLDKQTGRSSRCMCPPPKGCSRALYTMRFVLALQDSRRGGGGVCAQPKSSLALPLFVSSDQ